MTVPAFSPRELARRLEGRPPPVVVDLRGEADYRSGTIPGARHLAADDLGGIAAALVRDLDRRRMVVLVCGWGHRSALACISLKRAGFREVGFLEGGIESWLAEGLALSPGGPGGRAPEPDRRAAAAGEP